MNARALTVCAVLVSAGCGRILGVDAYSTSNEDVDELTDAAQHDGQALRDPGALFDEKPPWLTSQACKACMQEHCAAEKAVCDETEFCATYIAEAAEHVGALAPPFNYRSTYLPPLADMLWAYFRDEPNDLTAAIPVFNQCLAMNCGDACDIGRDFSCVGSYEWPATEAGEKEIRVFLSNESGIGSAGFALNYCLSLIPCDIPGSGFDITTDERGFAEFTVDTPPLPLGFEGALWVDGGPETTPFMFTLPAGPIESGFLLAETVLSKDWVDKPYFDLGGKPDDTRGAIWVMPVDCRGDPARNVVVELFITNDLGHGYAPCEDCAPAIYAGGNGPDPALTELSSVANRAILANVPPRYALVLVRDAETRRVVAVQRLVTRPVFMHVTRPYPATARQLTAVPPNLL